MTRTVDIRQTGRAIAVGDGQTILEAALAAGIAYPHGCRSGRCGACKSQLMAGEVDMLPHTRFALTAEEKAQGLILACRAQLLTSVEVAWLGKEDGVVAYPALQVKTDAAAAGDATLPIAPGPPLQNAACQASGKTTS